MRKILLCILLVITLTGCQSSKQEVQQPVTENTVEEKKTTEAQEINETKKTEEAKESTKQTQTTKENETQTKKEDTEQKATNNKKTTQKQTEENTKQEVIKEYCTMTISCKNVLDNKDKLESNYQVPANGIIYNKKMEMKSNDTVLSLLKRTGVRIDVQSGYVRGIDNLYEFDCGKNSGWMYKVNGVRPNVGASKYKIKKNDKIEWFYTCQYGDA